MTEHSNDKGMLLRIRKKGGKYTFPAALGIFLIAVLLLVWFYGSLKVLDEPDNYKGFRGGFEFLYFLTNSFIVFVAWYAITFARRQSEEAEKARLANVYIEVGNRWFAGPISDSRIAIANIAKAYARELERRGLHGPRDPDVREQEMAEHFHEELTALLGLKSSETYAKTMALANFFEDVGLMVYRQYLNIDDMEQLLKTAVISTYKYLRVHIDSRRRNENAYTMYQNFEWLADELISRAGRVKPKSAAQSI